MAASCVLVPLPQMVDLALGSPEVGAVNFNILHSLLHVLIQQVDLQQCSVEFRGEDCNRVQSLISTAKTGPSLNLTEYRITESGKKIVKKGKTRSSDALKETELKTIEQRKNSKEEPKQPDAIASINSKVSVKSKQSMTTVVIVEAGTDQPRCPQLTVTVTQEKFKEMEIELLNLKTKIKELIELPSNAGLIEAIRNASVDKPTPVVDMLQVLNVNMRIEAAEAGVNKLASMLEDLVRNIGVTQEIIEKSSDTKVLGAKGSHTGSQGSGLFGDLIKRIEQLEVRMESIPENTDDDKQGEDEGKIKKEMATKDDISSLKKAFQKMESEIGQFSAAFKGKDLAAFVSKLEELTGKGGEDDETGEGGGKEGEESPPKFSDLEEKIVGLDETFNNQINQIQNQLTVVEKELAELLEKVNVVLPNPDEPQVDSGNVGMGELFNKVNQLEESLGTITETATKLLTEQEERQLSLDAMLEQIELLKTIKADREDLEDALADKADANMMNRKVSHDQFDAACDDLSKGLEDAFLKLTQQEALWQAALEDIQTNVGAKLDKSEFDPLREFVNAKIKKLQERLKALIALKKEQEAAGAKSRFLRNVNCLSCDKDVIMNKENQFATVPMAEAMPGTRSMRPYLSYELDAVRKQQKCLPQGRDMNFLESALKEQKTVRKEKMIDRQAQAGDHLCNRYCGGSHTLTTPQQRVTRVGHFLSQWGPEAIPLKEGQILGKDGQMYRARESGDASAAGVQKPRYQSASMQTEDFPSKDSPGPSESKGVRLSSAGKRLSGQSRGTSVTITEPAGSVEESAPAERGSSAAEGGKTKRESLSRKGSARLSSDSQKRGSKSSVKRGSHSSRHRSADAKRASHVSQKENKPPAEGGEAKEGGDEGEMVNKASASSADKAAEGGGDPASASAEGPPTESQAEQAPE